MTGEDFNSTRSLHMNIKNYSTFIQTDKSIYKPGDIVKFRILVLDGDTKPFKVDDIKIIIVDSDKNIIKKFKDANEKMVKGVYKNELQLSDTVNIGKWEILVKIKDDKVTAKEFEVDEYVLPKFELLLDVEPANYKDGKIRATVKAKYTFGKLAKGTAKVTAKVERSYHSFGRRYRPKKLDPVIVTKQVDVDGIKFVEFDMYDELKLNKSNYDNVKLTATFVEEMTKKEVTTTNYVKIEKLPYKLDLSWEKYNLKAGLPFKLTAKIISFNKAVPITDKQNPIKFNITYKYDIMSTCIKRSYPKDFDPWFRVNNPNSTVTQRTLTDNDLIKKEVVCRDEQTIEEIKEAYPVDGIAEVEIMARGNMTEVVVKVIFR
jgi:CD109 antigen